MSKKSEEGRIALSLRLTTGMHKKLAEEAEKNHRSVNMQIIHLIAKAGFLVMMFSLDACTSENVRPEDPRIAEYFSKFERESYKRGVEIDWSGFTVEFVDHDHGGGISRFDPNTKIVYFDTLDWCYKHRREELVIHELGHALLRRQHDFSRLPNYMYKTIMGNFAHPAYSGWSADSLRYREEYYYNELFNKNQNPPAWALSLVKE